MLCHDVPIGYFDAKFDREASLFLMFGQEHRMLVDRGAGIGVHLGALQRKQIQKIRDYYGSGWLDPGLTRNFFFGKSSNNSHKPVLICWSSIPCVFSMNIHC